MTRGLRGIVASGLLLGGCVAMPPMYPGRVLGPKQIQLGYDVQLNSQVIEQHQSVNGTDEVFQAASPYLAYGIDTRLGEPFGWKHWETSFADDGLLMLGARRQWLNPDDPHQWASAYGFEAGTDFAGRWLEGLTLSFSTPESRLNADLGLRLGHEEGPNFAQAGASEGGSSYDAAWYAPEASYLDLYGGLRLDSISSDLSVGAWVRWQTPDHADYLDYGTTVEDRYGPTYGLIMRYAFTHIRTDAVNAAAAPGRAVEAVSLPAPQRSTMKRDKAGHLALGQDLLLGKFYPDAAAEFQAVLDEEPTNAAALKGLGYLYFVQGDHEQALPYYRRALQADPSDSWLAAWLKNLDASSPASAAPEIPGAPH